MTPHLIARCGSGLREFVAYLKSFLPASAHSPADDMISRMVLIEDEGDKLTAGGSDRTVFLMYLATATSRPST